MYIVCVCLLGMRVVCIKCCLAFKYRSFALSSFSFLCSLPSIIALLFIVTRAWHECTLFFIVTYVEESSRFWNRHAYTHHHDYHQQQRRFLHPFSSIAIFCELLSEMAEYECVCVFCLLCFLCGNDDDDCCWLWWCEKYKNSRHVPFTCHTEPSVESWRWKNTNQQKAWKC